MAHSVFLGARGSSSDIRGLLLEPPFDPCHELLLTEDPKTWPLPPVAACDSRHEIRDAGISERNLLGVAMAVSPKVLRDIAKER